MLQDQESQPAEEVSRGIDMLNAGKETASDNQEIAEMLEMAGLVKQSYNQGDIPKALIAEMADTLAAELAVSKKKRRRQWLYGSLAGTAAALFIAVSAHMFLPGPSGQHLVQQNDTEQQEQQMAVNSGQSGTTDVPATRKEAVPQPEGSGSPVPENGKSGIAERQKKLVPGIVQDIVGENDGKTPDKEAESGQMAILHEEHSKDIHSSSALLAKNRQISGTEEKSLQDASMEVMLVLPDRTAQSVTVDHENKIIRQVYILEDNAEIVITQKATASSGASRADGETRALKLPDGSSTGKSPGEGKLKNSLKISRGAYDITIEGAKTEEELRLLGASLVVKKVKE
ncbi:putative membrane protein [Propionispora sp. 2/2-37]|uniref:hypothetical protein n=1 Tax=Propionispora sp. 2/2-37 TaxID=1677858 RepID=UPI0006BB855F|nr:hypothetical protein [Propionispora sp. 2/2-37]CUH94854.1 putative membrane protein [Propionispora sp. 2/2-37]